MQRFQIQIALEVILPESAPALVDGLPKGRQRFLLVTAQCVDLHVLDPIAIRTKTRNCLDVLKTALQQQIRSLLLAGFG